MLCVLLCAETSLGCPLLEACSGRILKKLDRTPLALEKRAFIFSQNMCTWKFWPYFIHLT